MHRVRIIRIESRDYVGVSQRVGYVPIRPFIGSFCKCNHYLPRVCLDEHFYRCVNIYALSLGNVERLLGRGASFPLDSSGLRLSLICGLTRKCPCRHHNGDAKRDEPTEQSSNKRPKYPHPQIW